MIARETVGIHPVPCPPSETLASVMDGRATVTQRGSVIEHLDDCTDCRTVVGDAAAYECEHFGEAITYDVRVEEWIQKAEAIYARKDKIQKRRKTWAVLAPLAAAATLALLLGPPLATTIAQWFSSGPATDPFASASSATLVTALIDTEEDRTLLALQAWPRRTGAFAFASGVKLDQASFQLGVRIADLRIASRSGDARQFGLGVDSVNGLLDVVSDEEIRRRWRSLSNSEPSFVAGIDGFEARLGDALRSEQFLLGAFSEVSRLAAKHEAGSYFESSTFREALDALQAMTFHKDVERLLREIQGMTDRRGSFAELETQFEQLILARWQ